MRWLLACLLFLTLPCTAQEIDPHKQWLAFRDAFAVMSGGPTGMYAIQDMIVLEPGEAAYLQVATQTSARRWSKTAIANSPVIVEYRDGRVAVRGDVKADDLLQAKEPLKLPDGLLAVVTRRDTLKLWLYNPKLPAERGFKSLAYFPYDTKGVVEGTFTHKATPEGINHLDSRNHTGLMYWIGTVDVTLGGKKQQLRAFNYQKDPAQQDHFLLLLRDRTSGKATYGGGRVLEYHFPKGKPPTRLSLNFNTLYSFLCAHSEFYNCPINLTDKVDATLTFGEKDPAIFEKPARAAVGK